MSFCLKGTQLILSVYVFKPHTIFVAISQNVQLNTSPNTLAEMKNVCLKGRKCKTDLL